MSQHPNRIEFYVPAENMVDFALILTSAKIDNEIIGVTDSDEIIVYAEYTNEQDAAIAELTELVDFYDFEEGNDDENINMN